jgi:SRSO17 transposase
LTTPAFPRRGGTRSGWRAGTAARSASSPTARSGSRSAAATDEASCPLDWRLFIPEEWDEDQERRRKAHLPDDIRHVEKWKLALEAIDELRDWGLRPPVILADSG